LKARYKHLLDHSIGCVLGSIEVYNKPLFKEREQVFAILLVTAWESLLKAKILKDNKNRLTSLYVRAGKRYKKTRTGRYLTVELLGAAKICALNPVVFENLERLVDVRDAAIHLTAESRSLPYLVYTLGLAALRNYAKLLDQWFRITLDEYDLFILPVGFKYPFKTVTPAAMKKEPSEVAEILKQVAKSQSEGKDESAGFHLAFEISTTLVSAKKLTEPADITAAIDPLAKGAIVVEKRVRLVDAYPHSFTELWKRVKAALPAIQQSVVFGVIKESKLKGDPKYSAYNWRNKAQEARGPQATVPVIYNDDAVRLVIEECGRRLAKGKAA
jgi:hypothetical protein